ncbi:IclR family transcriptional regulator C-terminal domain-containing protein [Rhodococcus sp. D-6]|uniref:IclR family transcriptional regulator C-terminal domain-containing protein n=2 Tax=unclassified Rhodococcus (in: high G+C Gram-positive bacteria) TaxID=192944 RepID=A0AAU7USG8_9NOCA
MRAFVAVAAVAPGPIRYDLSPGTVLPVHAGAAGRAILAQLGAESLSEVDLTSFTSETLTDRSALEAVLAQDRANGYTISVGQHFALAAGVAAPFRFGELLGAVSVTRPRYDTSDEDLRRFAPLVQDAARRLSALPMPTASDPAPRNVPRAHGVAAVESLCEAESSTALVRFERLVSALVAHPAGIESMSRPLGKRIGANPATAAKLLAAALKAGIAIMRDDRAMAGPRLLHWAAAVGSSVDLEAVIGGIAQALAAEIGETVGVTAFDHTTVCAEQTIVVPGTRPMHYGLATGVEVPLHAGAAGKAILAELPADTLDDLALTKYTERTVTNRAELSVELGQIRAKGWATGDGERIPDAFGVAAPYFVDGVVGGSVTVTIPRYRIPELDIDSVAAAVLRATREITRMLTV